jgi:methionyl-tRNA formyltransferase
MKLPPAAQGNSGITSASDVAAGRPKQAMMPPPLKYSRILIITDNEYLLTQFKNIVSSCSINGHFTYRYSVRNNSVRPNVELSLDWKPIDLKKEWASVAGQFDLVFSLHCKQLFPAALVRATKCINIHPGLNPYNRGWYPQVFSLINKLPLGATIHEIDEEIDHGVIIDQEEVAVFSWDTSLTAYERVLDAELRLIRNNLLNILRGEYPTRLPVSDGNLNMRADFRQLCFIDRSALAHYGEVIDRLRALSHGDYWNAYFIDETGRKIFLRLQLEPEPLGIAATL